MTVALLVGAIPSPPENAIGIGPLQLRAYGLAIAAGVLVAVWVAHPRRATRGGVPAVHSNQATWSVIAG
ncbi:MAG: prolipoprotein diacylglyceryl transferase, partial [Acidimicrobiia bacterium]